MDAPLQAVTGGFGFSGGRMAARLLAAGFAVRTLTNSPRAGHPLFGRVETRPLAFDDAAALTESLRGVETLYNTYWVRFTRKSPGFSHAAAVENTLRLFAAAQAAGVRRVVHVSITNPSLESPLPYFRGKAQLEAALAASGMSYAILRPAVLFGPGDILVNNIAFLLRRVPFFAVFGDGQYRLQPIHVDDFAALAVACGRSRDNCIVNAIGPETFTYRELVAALARILGKRRPIVSVSPGVAYGLARVFSFLLRDVVLTRDEIAGLMGDLLYVPDAPAAGATRLTAWAQENRATLGRHYASELARRRGRA